MLVTQTLVTQTLVTQTLVTQTLVIVSKLLPFSLILSSVAELRENVNPPSVSVSAVILDDTTKFPKT